MSHGVSYVGVLGNGNVRPHEPLKLITQTNAVVCGKVRWLTTLDNPTTLKRSLTYTQTRAHGGVCL